MAEAKQDSYHPNLVEQYGRLLWIPDDWEEVDQSAEVAVVSAAAETRYRQKASAALPAAAASLLLYSIAGVLIFLVITWQAVSVAREGGLL